MSSDVFIILCLLILCLLPSIGGLIAVMSQRSKCKKCREIFPSIETKCFHKVYICREQECPK